MKFKIIAEIEVETDNYYRASNLVGPRLNELVDIIRNNEAVNINYKIKSVSEIE